jgi:methionyl-tRNA formyltransferase
MARVILITSHYMGVLYMRKLLEAGDTVVGVVAWPSSAGWYVPEEYDVRNHALRYYLPLYEPDPKKLNSPDFLRVVKRLRSDFIVSGYYPQLFKPPLLRIPPGGCVNIHPTGLPRFRGLSPYFSHMLHGDERNYITMHWLDEGTDTGDIIAQTSVEIYPDDTGFTCGHRLTEAGADMFSEYWPRVKEGTAPRSRQDETKASVFNFDWSMAEIDWNKTSTEIWDLVRSIAPPLNGAWTMGGGRKIRIEKAWPLTGHGLLKAPEAVPGQVLALTGRGMVVQCGTGQLQVVTASVDSEPQTAVFDVLAPAAGTGIPVLLG